MHTAHPAACNTWHSVFVALLSRPKFCVQIHFCGYFLIGRYWGYTRPQLSQILRSNSQATGCCTLLKGRPLRLTPQVFNNNKRRKAADTSKCHSRQHMHFVRYNRVIFVLNILEAYTRPMAIWYKLQADLYTLVNVRHGRSQCPCGLRRGSASTHLLGLRVRIPPGTWMSVSWERCVL